MKSTLKIKLGSKVLELQGESDEKTMIKKFSFWSSLPDKCGKCGSVDIALFHRSPKNFDYYGLTCLSCGADYNFGQLKAGGFFLKDDEQWSVYQGGNGDKPENAAEAQEEDSF